MWLVSVLPVAVRRLLVRRPWIYWAVVSLACGCAVLIVHQRVQRIDATRSAWGEARRAWVASADAAPGEALLTTVREVPVALLPVGVLDPEHDPLPVLARQHVSAGEIVTGVDVVPPGRGGPLALVPDGWLVVPVLESTPSGAADGARVQVASGGVVIAPEALVVGHYEQAVLIAVPAEAAAMIPAAAEADGVALLQVP
jgi:hypothetical protein